MAKIIVFSDAISDTLSRSEFTKQIVNHAAETANEIYFVTQNDNAPEMVGYHPKVQIMRAFRKWNFMEATKLLPILLGLRADIFHFVQPHKEIGFGHAFPILAAFAKTLNTQNIFSLVDFETKLPRGIEAMISVSQVVSVIDPSQESPLKRRFRRVQIECLPAQAFRDLSSSHEFETISESPFIFLPENLNHYKFPSSIIKILVAELKKRSELHLTISGSLLDFDLKRRREILQELDPVASRVKWTGPLSQKTKFSFVKSANMVLLAGLRFSPHLIHENLGFILSSKAPTIMTPQQVMISQISIENNVHAKVVEESQIEQAISELASSELRNTLRNNLAQLSLAHSADELGNRLSRIYTKLLS